MAKKISKPSQREQELFERYTSRLIFGNWSELERKMMREFVKDILKGRKITIS